MFHKQKGESLPMLLILIVLAVMLIISFMFLWPKYRVWQQNQAGMAELAKAEQTRKIEAKAAKRGLWADKHAMPPWEWRKEKRK